MNPRSTLLAIVAHARSGALDHAWRLYREAGLYAIDDDDAVLSVRGRLLKDRAAVATGDERRRWRLEAARAYGRAAELSRATYPLINAATLWLLAGETEQARGLAREALERLDRGEGEPDTPYWQEATRAEALLLLGRVADAKAALTGAVARAPRAWEDHASTLRQFAAILDHQREDPAWLDALRPPRSLHFAGHMALGADDAVARERVDEVLRDEAVGFGFGALAAGADIVIAEALLARGAELHLTLPAGVDAFRQACVAPYGENWAERFDRVLARADTLRAIDHAEVPGHPLAVRLAAEIAMGSAAMHAHTLMTSAVQLLILDETGGAPTEAGGTAWAGALWRSTGRAQQVAIAPRDGSVANPAPPDGPSASPVLAAFLVADLSGPGSARHLDAQAVAVAAQAIEGGPTPLERPRWCGERLELAYASPLEAARAALALASALAPIEEARIAGHYGLIGRTPDPFGGPPLWLGASAGVPLDVLDSVPPGAIHVSEDFAAALCITPAVERPRVEYVGDLPPDASAEEMRLFSLKA